MFSIFTGTTRTEVVWQQNSMFGRFRSVSFNQRYLLSSLLKRILYHIFMVGIFWRFIRVLWTLTLSPLLPYSLKELTILQLQHNEISSIGMFKFTYFLFLQFYFLSFMLSLLVTSSVLWFLFLLFFSFTFAFLPYILPYLPLLSHFLLLNLSSLPFNPQGPLSKLWKNWSSFAWIPIDFAL